MSIMTNEISPAEDALILVAVTCADSDGVPTITGITGCGMTWEQVVSLEYGFRRRAALYRAQGSPTTGRLTISFTGSGLEDAAYKVIEVAGAFVGGNGANCISQVAQASAIDGVGATGAIAQLTTTPDDYDAVFTMLAMETDIGSTVDAAYTQTGTRASSDNTRSLHTAVDVETPWDLTPNWTWEGSASWAAFTLHILGQSLGTPPTVPAAPAAPTLTPSVNRITVNWEVPASGGSPITGYTVTAYIDGLVVGSQSTSSTTSAFLDLDPVDEYTFDVYATNAIGNGPQSPMSAPGSAVAAAEYTGFPDDTNTGHLGSANPRLGTALTVHEGNFTTSSTNQIIQDLEVRGRIIVNHDGVLIRNCWVKMPAASGNNSNGIDQLNAPRVGGRLVIEDTTVDGSAITVNDGHGLSLSYYNAYRVNVFGWSKGAECWGNCIIEDSYFHDYAPVGPNAHREGLHPYVGTNIEIRHNTVIMDRTDGTSGGIYAGASGERSIIVEYNLVGSLGGYVFGGGDAMTCENNAVLSEYDGRWGVFTYMAGPPSGTASQCGNYWYDAGDGHAANDLIPGDSACV